MENDALTDSEYWDESWNRVPIKVKRIHSLHPFYGKHGVFQATVKKHLGDISGQSVLELGGGGLNYRLVSLQRFSGADVAAIDFAAEGLHKLRHCFQANDAEITCFQGDFFDHDFGEQKFDILVHWGVLEHFTHLPKFMELCSRLLKPGGRMLFSMPNMEGLGAKSWAEWSPDNWTKHIYHSDEAVRKGANSANLTLEKSFYLGYPFISWTTLEVTGALPFIVSRAQRALSLAASVSSVVSPFYGLVGNKTISQDRGFLLAKE